MLLLGKDAFKCLRFVDMTGEGGLHVGSGAECEVGGRTREADSETTRALDGK